MFHFHLLSGISTVLLLLTFLVVMPCGQQPFTATNLLHQFWSRTWTGIWADAGAWSRTWTRSGTRTGARVLRKAKETQVPPSRGEERLQYQITWCFLEVRPTESADPSASRQTARHQSESHHQESWTRTTTLSPQHQTSANQSGSRNRRQVRNQQWRTWRPQNQFRNLLNHSSWIQFNHQNQSDCVSVCCERRFWRRFEWNSAARVNKRFA